ncbi:unnamed protein product [Zymoseptoria tritici ST99CH_3D7]|uniref:GST N-terminal domain-containing protein n=1 Tax=Zymoseptoria tritici (strain ST99CH_3D7) TaxID=1276538 RepID=A0A1X7S953_ZYMT9|nr:unnamed protein product [Zymoseptoria tritici ST99CH_3D7]
MVLQVYLDPCTINCRKVLAGLDMMDVKYEEHFVSFFKGEQKGEDYVKNINPHATVPAAVDGDLKLTESNSILMYAADVAGSDAYPKDLKLRADANRWLLWEASVWFGTNYTYLVENVVKELMGGQPDQSVLSAEEPKWNKAASILDARLGETGKWIIPGPNPTIVDIAVASPMHLHGAAKVPLDQHRNLKRWIADRSPPKQGQRDPKAVNIHEPGDDPFEVAVHNGWDRVADFSVDKEGFAVKDFNPSFPNNAFNDDSAVREKFYPEVVEFLKKELGAKRVLVFDHTIRTKANQAKPITDQSNTSQRAPVALVHCDYTAESGPVRVKQLLPDEADDLLARRTAFINVWKPLNKVEEYPLAMCDVTSSPPEDFFKLYLRYQDRTGENYVMRRNEKHDWVYFPDMTPDKSILLKTYDSDKQRAQFVGHSAFVDPTSKPDAPARESVEIRTICFF